MLSLEEEILISLYSARFCSARISDLSSIIYIGEYILEDRKISVEEVDAMGPKSREIVLIIHYLNEEGLIDIGDGYIKLSELGQKLVEEMLIEPNNSLHRKYYSITKKLWKLSRVDRLTICGHLWRSERQGRELPENIMKFLLSLRQDVKTAKLTRIIIRT